MLIIPIAAILFIGGSYLMAVRFLPQPRVMKAVPWMAGAALVGYFAAQIVFVIVLRSLSIPIPGVVLLIAVSLLGAAAGAALVLRGFVLRHRRRKAEKDAQAAVF